MASPTPSFSCPPCGDTPLAIGGSVITFLTFISGLIAGLSYWYGLAKSSPVEIQKFIEELYGSFDEIKSLVVEMESVSGVPRGVEIISAQPEDEISHRTKNELENVLGKLQWQMDSLYHLQEKVDRRNYNSSRSARWFRRTGRLNYLIIRDELQQKVVEKDRLMTEYRHIHQRALKIENDRVEKEHREKQETMQLEQVQMLESILRRVIRLEASVRTSTKDKTSSPDPPPESTD